MIRSVDDLSDGEVNDLIKSMTAIIADEPENEEKNDTLDSGRIVVVLGRTADIPDIAVFERQLMERYIKILKNSCA